MQFTKVSIVCTASSTMPEDYKAIMTDANLLYKGCLASLRQSDWKEPNQIYYMHFLRHIFELQDKLENQTFQNGPHNIFILHERGRIRPVTSFTLDDKIVRHVLCDNILLPVIRNHVIYDCTASVPGRGLDFQRRRYEVHLRKFHELCGDEEGFILYGDFTKFYDNILQEKAKDDVLRLFDYDEYLDWLLSLILDGFKIDVSYMNDEEYAEALYTVFNKLEYLKIPKELLTGEKFLKKSADIGDQFSQILGIYYPHRIDSYVKYVRQQKFYGRFNDDFYIMSQSKEELLDILAHIKEIAVEYGIHLNDKKTKIVSAQKPQIFLKIRYTFKNDKLIKRINPERVTSMRRKLKKLAVKVENGELPYENAQNTFRSWMGSFYKIMSKEQRKSMIELFETLFNKKVAIVKHKMIITDNTGGCV